MTKEKRLIKEIERLKLLAYKDELTGLVNRRGFKEEAEKFISEVMREKGKEHRKSFAIRNFGLIIFDVDNFKKINDTYGHPAGDEALKFLGKKVVGRVRDIDIVGRWGGEELVV